MAPFSRAVFEARVANGKDIASEPGLVGLLESLGIDADAALAQAGDATNKGRLREATAEAQRIGIFGAHSFVTEDGELFWGDDRLDMALAHARQLVGSS